MIALTQVWRVERKYSFLQASKFSLGWLYHGPVTLLDRIQVNGHEVYDDREVEDSIIGTGLRNDTHCPALVSSTRLAILDWKRILKVGTHGGLGWDTRMYFVPKKMLR